MKALGKKLAGKTLLALSMAGIPPLNGFLSKELMLEEAAHTALGPAWLLPLLVQLQCLLLLLL